MNLKTYFIIITVLIISGLVYYFTQSKSTLDDEFEIALPTIEETDFIQLINESGTISFVKKNDKWLVNNLFEASYSRIETMLKMLHSLSVSNPITGKIGKKVKDIAINNGIQVICKSGKKTITNIYFISNPLSLKGNFAYAKDHQYAVHLNPLSIDDKITSFLAVDLSWWQSKTIFNFAPSDIQQINVEWNETENSFTIKKDVDGEFKLWLNGIVQSKNVDNNKVKFYTYEFRNIQMNSKDVSFQGKKGNLECNVSVITNDERTLNVSFYELIKEDGSIDKNNLVVNMVEANNWGVTPYLRVSPCLKKASFFQTK